jgi:DUF4097 and DUF4098 domain-containing protein YvlB
MKSVLPAISAAVLLPLALGGCVVVDSQGHIARDERRFTITGTPELKLTTFDGSIEIRSDADTKTVLVEIEKRGPTKEAIDELKIETKQDGDRIEIEVKRPSREVAIIGFGRISSTAKLIVTIPRDSNITARSGDGGIRIERVRGRVDLRTGDGSVRATGVGGQLTIATGDGSVAVDDVDGDLDIDTGDGSVSVSGKLGNVRLHTGDGAITLRAESGTAMKDDWSMTTGDGGVALFLPSDFGAQLDAHTGDGTIRNDLKIDNKSPDEGRRTLRGTLGAGGKTLRIRTGDGGIRLKIS